MSGKYIIIHKQTEYLGKHYGNDIRTWKGRLCNPYDADAVTTLFNLEVTCKTCRKIIEKSLGDSK